MAGATLTALPVLTFFVLVQKRIAFELTAGAVKGWCFDGRDPLQQRDEGARAVLELPSVRPELEGYVGRCIAVGIRPENVRDASLAPDGARLQGCTLLVEELGAELLAHVEVSATPLGKIDLVDAASVPSDGVEVLTRSATLLGRFPRESGVSVDEQIEVTIDARKLHFFDLDNGDSIRSVGAPVPAAVER